jgi:hypothetical protein
MSNKFSSLAVVAALLALPMSQLFARGDARMGARIVLGGAGLIVGTIAGAAASKADKAINPLMNHDFSALKPLAQFPEQEPEYLSAVK